MKLRLFVLTISRPRSNITKVGCDSYSYLYQTVHKHPCFLSVFWDFSLMVAPVEMSDCSIVPALSSHTREAQKVAA